MKKAFVLATLLLLGIIAVSTAQITTVEYLRQHPEIAGAGSPGSTILPAPGVDDANRGVSEFSYTYVGYFDGLSGVNWQSNPPCYTGQEAAALLFGGSPAEYAISTNPSTDPGTITHTAWMVTWGVSGWYEYPENYKYDPDPVGYNAPGGTGTATSAYVWDNPPPPGSSINYVWRITGQTNLTPVSDWALALGIVLILAVAIIRYRRS